MGEIDPPFDRIEVLFAEGTDDIAVQRHLAALRSVPFRKYIKVRPHYYSTDNRLGMHRKEAWLASDLIESFALRQLVLKYPSALAGRGPSELQTVFTTWSKAVRRTVPADADLVYMVPENFTGTGLVPCEIYMLSRGGAQKLVDAAPQTSSVTAYLLDHD